MSEGYKRRENLPAAAAQAPPRATEPATGAVHLLLAHVLGLAQSAGITKISHGKLTPHEIYKPKPSCMSYAQGYCKAESAAVCQWSTTVGLRALPTVAPQLPLRAMEPAAGGEVHNLVTLLHLLPPAQSACKTQLQP